MGEPLEFCITAGPWADCSQAIGLLGTRRARAVIADKGYDADAIVEHIATTMRAEAVIPPRSNRKRQRSYDRALYRQRNRIERCFHRLKQFRRLATRYEKSKLCFHALVALACSGLLLASLYVDTA